MDLFYHCFNRTVSNPWPWKYPKHDLLIIATYTILSRKNISSLTLSSSIWLFL